MAIAKNIATDHKLSVRMFVTGLLLVLLYGIAVSILIAVGINAVLVLVIAAGLMFAQYWFSDRLALFGMGGKVVTREEAPELYGTIERLCALADMKMPVVAIADVDMPNAFATGRSPKTAVVCVTTGLMARLDERELDGVLAHELSHIAHRDVAIMTIASTLGMAAGLITRFAFYANVFGGNDDEDSGGAEVAVLAISAVVYAISFFLTRALSRYREMAADRSGALLIGQPSALASALVKITGAVGQIPTKDLRSSQAFNAFFFTPAIKSGDESFALANLLSTHPTLEARLAQLSELEHQLHGH